MTINLASLDTAAASETPYDLELISPFDGEPTGLFIQVLGHNCDAVRAVQNEQRNRDRKRLFEAQRTGKPQIPTSDDDDADGLEIAVAATVGWYEKKKGGKREDGLPFGDKRLTFSKDEARKLYSMPGLGWMGGQVVRAMYDLGNFTKR